MRIANNENPCCFSSFLFLQTLLLPDTQTGVMIFPDFEGPDGDYEAWQADVYNGVTHLL
jgi:hypothetical protein